MKKRTSLIYKVLTAKTRLVFGLTFGWGKSRYYFGDEINPFMNLKYAKIFGFESNPLSKVEFYHFIGVEYFHLWDFCMILVFKKLLHTKVKFFFNTC